MDSPRQGQLLYKGHLCNCLLDKDNLPTRDNRVLYLEVPLYYFYSIPLSLSTDVSLQVSEFLRHRSLPSLVRVLSQVVRSSLFLGGNMGGCLLFLCLFRSASCDLTRINHMLRVMQAFDWSVLFLHVSIRAKCIGYRVGTAGREEGKERTLGWLYSPHCECVCVCVCVCV